MELTHVLEKDVVCGDPDRWQVVNCSSGITAEVVRVGIDSEHSTHDNYELRITGDDLEGKVVIVKRRAVSRHDRWQIFEIVRSPESGDLKLQEIKPKTASHPGATLECGWFWEGNDCIWQNLTVNGYPTLKFNLKLDHWGVPETIENHWDARTYFQKLQRASGIKEPYGCPLIQLVGIHATEIRKICEANIATRKQLAELKAGKTRVEEILRSIMDRDPMVEHGRILALMKTGGAAGNLASVINGKLHGIADALGIELGSGCTSRHKSRVRSR